LSEHVVGIDCAAQPKNIGLALGRLDGASVRVLEAVTGADDVIPVLTRWAEAFAPKIYALDAPLGWPHTLGATLNTHRAGSPVGPTSHELFRRITDDFVHAKLGKRPLEVGADRIARAAVTTLKLLDRLRTETQSACRSRPARLRSIRRQRCWPGTFRSAVTRATGPSTGGRGKH